MQNSAAYQIELLLIRHGKTPGNAEKRYIGRTDESLSKEGIAELSKRNNPAAELYFSSPMKRCKESLQVLFGRQDCSIISDFKEIDFGFFEGKNYKELSGNLQYQAWIDSGGTMAFPEGESREDFCKRSVKGFREMTDSVRRYLEEHCKSEIRVAAVVHGGTIMAILSTLYGGDYYDYQISNGEAYRLTLNLGDEGAIITAVERVNS